MLSLLSYGAILFRGRYPIMVFVRGWNRRVHSSFLVLRTILSILVARLDGRIVRDLVKADGKGFEGLGPLVLVGHPQYNH